MAEDRCAIVLAGGHSRRFGPREKAIARLAGVPMIRRVIDRLETVVDSVLVSCRASQRSALAAAIGDSPCQLRFVYDEADSGPVGGLLGTVDAIERGAVDRVFLTACDMPCLDPAVIELLFESLASAEAVVPRDRTGRDQPLHGVYRLDPLSRALDRCARTDRHALEAVTQRLTVRTIDSPAVRQTGRISTFCNVNTPRDLLAIEHLLSGKTE